MEKLSWKERRKNHIKRPKDEVIILTLTSIIFILYSFTLIYPLFWGLFAAFKTAREYKNNIYGIPKTWVIDNFKKALATKIGATVDSAGTSLVGMFFNSVWSSFLSAFCSLFVSAMTAYVVTKYRFFGSKAMLTIAIIIQALPLVGTAPATYDLCYKLHLINNPWLFWVVWSGGFGYYFIVLCGYYKGLSMDYAEAAFIDGASHSRTFFSIMLPMAFPAIFSLFLVSFINSWNDYYTMYLYLNDYPTLSVGVYLWKNISAQNGGTPVYMAALILTVIPVVVLFACFQKTIMKQSLGGGLKG